MKINNRKRLSIVSALFLTIILISNTAHASIGSLLYENTIGKVLEDENSIRSLTMGVMNGFIDGVMVALVGCPTDGIVDNYGSNLKPCNLFTSGRQSLGNGSLYALATSSFGGAIEAPIPTNLAFYIKDIKQESLVFKEAQAASATDHLFETILVMWKAVRNASYGFLAGAVLIIAIMISLRSKIDPQTIVTAQAAIPKIVISAALITFSYAIGAIFAQGAGLWGPLTKVGLGFLSGNVSNAGFIVDLGPGIGFQNCPARLSNGKLSTFADFADCALWTVGRGLTLSINPGVAIAVMIAEALTVILLFALTFVYITRYLRIIMLTIFAPLIFAIAAIPGQEHRIKDWFVDMISATLSIPAMVFTTILAYYLFLSVSWAPGSSGIEGFLSSVFTPIVGSILMIATIIMALKVPGLIDNTLKPKKK